MGDRRGHGSCNVSRIESATAAFGMRKRVKAMEMYDTEVQPNDSLRREQETVLHAWMRTAALAAGTEDELFEPRQRAAVESDDLVGSLMAALAVHEVRKAA
jgi:hypothetical protein